MYALVVMAGCCYAPTSLRWQGGTMAESRTEPCLFVCSFVRLFLVLGQDFQTRQRRVFTGCL
jgi:hypothetical protein